MIVVKLNHWDGTSSEVNVPLTQPLDNLAMVFAVESVEILRTV